MARMIKKYENVAKQSGSMLFPEIGVESTPAELVAWSVAKHNRVHFGAKTGDVVMSVHRLKWVVPSSLLASAAPLTTRQLCGFWRHFDYCSQLLRHVHAEGDSRGS